MTAWTAAMGLVVCGCSAVSGAATNVDSAAVLESSAAAPPSVASADVTAAPTVTVTVTASATDPSRSPSPSQDVEPSTESPTTTTPVAEPTKPVELPKDTVFATPSENIVCGHIGSHGVFCSIGRKAWKFPEDLPRADDCTAPLGVALADKVYGWCVDVPATKQKIVPYGRVVQVNKFRCLVERSGVMCAGAGTESSFTLSAGQLTFEPRPKAKKKSPAKDGKKTSPKPAKSTPDASKP